MARERALDDAELAKVWAAAATLGYPFGLATQLLILTGARLTEIGSLRWAEINNGDNIIRLEGARTKSGKPHTIPLAPAALTILDVAPRIGSEFVFTIFGRKPATGWTQAKRELDAAAGVNDWRLHDLRRTMATGLQRLGFSLQVIEAVLGHTSGSRAGIVGVYQRHGFDAEKRAALEAWALHVKPS